MPIRFNAELKVEARDGVSQRTPNRRGVALLCGTVLVACAILYLAIEIGFARYALTGFLWAETEGTVLDASRTSTPSIQFSTSDGVPHVFREDYILLCGGRSSFCLIRNFNPGQVVPVVYDPGAPQNAFVHDWALFANVISWILVAGAGLMIILLTGVVFMKKPATISIRLGSRPHPS